MEKEKSILIGEKVREVLSHETFSPLLPESFMQTKPFHLDLSVKNKEASSSNMDTPVSLRTYIKETLHEASATWGVGGYGEKRNFYAASAGFQEAASARSIHLGLDVWVPAGTPLYAPLAGNVHSFQDNNKFLDYGPTIILEHTLGDVTFYTLYGHLSRESLLTLADGVYIESGEQIGTVGTEQENGSWPTHLHFQIIGDLLGMRGDFFGVAEESASDSYLSLCPDPSSMLNFR